MKRIASFLAALAVISSSVSISVAATPPIPPTVTRSSIDVIAGGRMRSPDGTLTTFTTRSTGADGQAWPGPYFLNVKAKIPIGSIVGGTSYYRCKLGYPNWKQSTGTNLTTTATAASGSNSLTSVASTTNVMPGMTISGTSIPSGTLVTAVAAGALTISQVTTGTITAGSITIRSTPGQYGSNTGEVAQTGGPIQIAAGVRTTFGNTAYTPIPVTFNGSDVGTVQQGQTLYSDWIYGAFVPGQDIEVDTAVFWDTAAHLYQSHINRIDLGEASVYNSSITAAPFGSSIDNSWQANPSWSGAVTQYAYGPASLICSTFAPASQRGYITLGDSLSSGTGDGYTYSSNGFVYAGNSAGYTGVLERMAQNLGVAHTNVSQGAKRLSDLLTSWQLSSTLMAGGPTHVVIQLGINDVAGGASLATMQTNFIAAAQMITAAGYKPIAATIGTETTTTDGGATTANQTAASGFTVGGVGQLYNDWLRTTGAPTYTAGRLLDFADAVMSARNSQKFRVDVTPFADWGGFMTRLVWVAGSGGTNGSYPITSTGGGCTTAPAITATVSGGAISTVVVNSVGVGCTSAPSFSTASITGLAGGSFTATASALTTGIHYWSATSLAGATLSSLGTVQAGGTATDANGTIATALQSQLLAALAY